MKSQFDLMQKKFSALEETVAKQQSQISAQEETKQAYESRIKELEEQLAKEGTSSVSASSSRTPAAGWTRYRMTMQKIAEAFQNL